MRCLFRYKGLVTDTLIHADLVSKMQRNVQVTQCLPTVSALIAGTEAVLTEAQVIASEQNV